MAISKEIYKVFEAIVGPAHVSDDPVICEGYRSGPGGYENGLGYERVMTRVPGCVIMPRTTEEVSADRQGLLPPRHPLCPLQHGILRTPVPSPCGGRPADRPEADERFRSG